MTDMEFAVTRLRNDGDSSSTSTASPDDAARVAAINSLHRAILYPPNSLLVAHSASFLSQGLLQLLSDKSYSVRQSAASAYGAMCGVVCSILATPNGRQNHVMLSALVDRFISWVLPLLSNVHASDGTTQFAVDALREFFSVGDVVGVERYAVSVLKACQGLLEDERTSLNLLHHLLGVLTLISLKFSRLFQPHFLDIVDLLLGWVLVPDLKEADRHVILDSFLQFQKHWVGNLHFSLGLLSKFLDDMDVLIQDGSHGTLPHFRRLLALLSCFSTVLQSTASGLLEMNCLEQITEPLSKMIPRLLGCLSVVGRKFGWSKWTGNLWKCLTLLAEILREKFSSFYPVAVDILFQSLDMSATTLPGAERITSIQVHEILKTNLQLLSLQKFGLQSSSVQKVLSFDAPISHLRLHPNHLVIGSCTATYIFMLQHGNDEVVHQAMAVLIEELVLLKDLLQRSLDLEYVVEVEKNGRYYSTHELVALVKFDLKVLLTCAPLSMSSNTIGHPDIAATYVKRSERLSSFILEKLDAFGLPVAAYIELQVDIIRAMNRLTAIELWGRYSVKNHVDKKSLADADPDKVHKDQQSSLIVEHLRKYGPFLVKALQVSSPLAVKVVALEWTQRFCENLITLYPNFDITTDVFGACGYINSVSILVFSVFDAASDREPEVRSRVALVLELLFQARLVIPMHFNATAELVLEKLGDPDVDIKNAFVRQLSYMLPLTIYFCGLCDQEIFVTSSNLRWKQLFALKQLERHLNSQQLVSILSYISQRWKVPLSSWIQRLVSCCRNTKDYVLGQHEETKKSETSFLWFDVKVENDLLERTCMVNNHAGAWWAIHEAARYCIATRLRTNLGGPTQTFAALERMLLDIALVLQLDNEQNDGNAGLMGSSGTHLLPMRLLLDFVEALKKNVYNAYEGSAILPSATPQSSLFFRANKKVCEEWFSRICEPMMNAGLALQCHDATVQYCSLRLQDLKGLLGSSLKEKSRMHLPENLRNIRDKFSGDVLRILRHMALALCKSHEPEALIGLQNWVSMTFSLLFVDENNSLNHSATFGPLAWISGLVYQAQGQYEKAAAHFTHLLQNEESLNSLGSEGVQFSIERVIESYTAICDWRSLESWLLQLQTLRSKHAGKSCSGALTTAGNEINAIHALANFDEGDFQSAWSYLDLTPKSSNELTLDPKLALQRSEQMLLQAMLLFLEGKADMLPHEIQKSKLMLEEILAVLPLDGLAEAVPYATQLHCIFSFEEGYKLHGTQASIKQHASILALYVESEKSLINRVRQDCNQWLKVFRVYRTVFPNSLVTLKLCLSLSSLAHKQGNLMLANRLISYLRDHVPKKYEDAFANLWSFVRPCIVSPESIISQAADSVLKAKACLKLSEWLRRIIQICFWKIMDDKFSGGNSGHAVDIEMSNFKSTLHVLVEEIVGTATKLSTKLCPRMGKSWMSYASWCFNQAKCSLFTSHENVLSSCSLSPILHEEVLPNRFNLTEDERKQVQYVILQLFQNSCDDCDNKGGEGKFWPDSVEPIENSPMKALMLQVINIIEDAAGAPDAENSSNEPLSVTLTYQLQSALRCYCAVLEERDLSSAIDDLVNVWWSLRRRRVNLFGHAAYGFMQFLRYSSVQLSNFQFTGTNSESLNSKSASYTLRATLYLLHILLNYGVELKDTIGPALSTIPLFPWQEVTPQLFARLSSHPEQVVRKQLEGVILMLAKLSPWSIVYPTLVDVKAYGEKPSEELHCILECLREFYPRLIQDVQLMINELENVTVLWEELWLSTLQDLHADVMRRINLLKDEATRIAENSTLTENEKTKINAAKYSAMMAPIVVALERRLASTSRKPETPHEMWFNEEYRERLKSAISKFKTAPTSVTALAEVWRPFHDIASSLASYQRKSSINLREVAPQLALLSSSDVPMPGLEKEVLASEPESGLAASLQGIVTIASFAEQVTILSTKTKPKKLVILGSDGEKYTYLLKGGEDLRLDARIMQLLHTLNSILRSSSATRTHRLGIRHYSVTPISGRAGLIQWVDNVISIYSIFKSWQNRVQLAQHSAMAPGNTKNSVPLPIPRPSDMFYGKIMPALKEMGIRRVISRRDWPHDVKRKVLLDLMKEVPRQLLHQELWCASEGFKAFSSKLRRYAGSVAAMSMVGHILGLGDRHLDNILVDFCSGDVVHIDYNVCFDKGQRLKVPEIVPFRLTQMIEAALGLTGVEGTFRANCVHLGSTCRVDTRDLHDDAAIGGEERKGMELAVSLSLFASRVQEIRVPLQEHHDLLLATLPAVESALERFADALHQYEVASALFHRADQERSTLVLHETSAKSIVAEATCNSEKTRASFEMYAREFTQAKSVVAEKAQEAATWIDQHGRTLDAVMVAGVPLTIVPEPTLAQCQDIDKEVSQLIAELDHGFESALSDIQAYSLALQRILPLNYLTTSSVHGWAQVLQMSANAPSSDILSLARRQAAELITKAHGNVMDSVRYTHGDLCFKVEKYVAEISKLEEECIELVNSVGSETETEAKGRLLSAFLKYMQSVGLVRKEDANFFNQSGIPYEPTKDLSSLGELEDKKDKVLSMLDIAVSSLYNDVKHRIHEIFCNTDGRINANHRFGTIFSEFEEQVEKCVLLSGFVGELQDFTGKVIPSIDTDFGIQSSSSEKNWAMVFKTTLLSCRNFIGQMIEGVLLDVIRSAVALNSEVMDVFGLISQIRGSIDTALEQLLEVEVERTALVELEKNYFVKVGLITEQQLALEEAASKGRDHLSWEEAEELASQEEACRAQLDQLHQTWNQREMRTASLKKREADLKHTLVSSESHFKSLIEETREPQALGSKALLTLLVKPFSELESADKLLSTFGGSVAYRSDKFSSLADLMRSGYSLSEYIWKFDGLLDNLSFFIWKIFVVDSFLDSCMHDVVSSADQNLGFDQLVNVIKKKLELQLQEHVGHYLKERVAPTFLAWLDKETEDMNLLTETTMALSLGQMKKDSGAVRKVQLILEEYCNAHETARAARSAALDMKRQVNELKEAIHKTSLEIVQLEWMYDALTPSYENRATFQKFLTSEDNLSSIILNLSRPKLLDGIQSAVTKIVRSVDCLQACEQNSIMAEGQLGRAMGWACGSSNSNSIVHTSAKTSGIPPEFHDHLMRRQQLLWEAKEKASDIVKICMSILEFEASTDGIFQIAGDGHPPTAGGDGRTWQQAYLNALTKLEVAYHSFTRTEQEWKLVQSTMEAASNGLYSATTDLCIVSLKAQICAYEASVALSAFARVSRVLAITEDLARCSYTWERKAAARHHSLMKDLSELIDSLVGANVVLLPLESVLSKDVAAMNDAMTKERETKWTSLQFMGRPYTYAIMTKLARTQASIFSQVWISPPDSVYDSNSNRRLSPGASKNAYAMSVLKRVEMKIDGGDIADNRDISIGEQVDYLLKQAMSIDNLCNMYEGWTPWI
ncbi:hypothetical protein K2173_014542 [Erythroxylum novogranatense]|uniref:non-specific serine/threonine protein kinase n=1 Tax=Erythroxylum novogranatense TaxID=1862640 RepID=A0AAV8S6A9_9ROSI|nr:hypothetical protein K2173_014542 [Erythroxylum novogranatense]